MNDDNLEHTGGDRADFPPREDDDPEHGETPANDETPGAVDPEAEAGES